MSSNVHVLFIGIILFAGVIMAGSMNMNAYAKKVNGDNDDNTLKGTSNDDRLKGKNGDDVFRGYSGADYFDCGKGKDAIKDFNPSEGDQKSSDCEKVNYKGKSRDDDYKSDNNEGGNSANQGISQGQSSKQSSQCVAGGDMETSCNNISAQNQANTGNNALGQQGGSADNSGDGENSAGQGISQGQSSKQSSQCVAGGSIDASCMNISAQNQANTGNSAAAQDGGDVDNSGDGEISAGQGISQGQSSDQENQCVSGEDAIVSCDNVAFQNMVNSGKNALGQTP